MFIDDVGVTYGWRKCSKSQARRTETARSGRPRWGLQALLEGWCWIIPSCWRALCCLKWWSTNLSLPTPETESSSPRLLLTAFIWPAIASFKDRNCLDMVFSASDVYDFAEPVPAACSNDEITICICWWYCLYLCSTYSQAIRSHEAYKLWTWTNIIIVSFKLKTHKLNNIIDGQYFIYKNW